MNIVAVVVTRDRPQLLVQALDALSAQTLPLSNVIVVDNASGEETRKILAARSDVSVHRLEENTGGAGGFATGVECALAVGADWIWLLDDDAISRPDALANLIDKVGDIGPQTGAVCSAVWEFDAFALQHRRYFHPDNLFEPAIALDAYQQRLVKVDTASFVGFLLNARAADSVGLPNSSFFLAYDDTEYSLRLGRAGWSIWLAPASVIDHKRSPQGRLRHGPFGVKHYYNLRNQLAVFRYYGRASSWRLMLPMIKFAWIALKDRKIASLKLWWRAIRDSRGVVI
jgi:GT2 family glycosyltransferase